MLDKGYYYVLHYLSVKAKPRATVGRKANGSRSRISDYSCEIAELPEYHFSNKEDAVKRVIVLCFIFLAIMLAASAGRAQAEYTWTAQGTASDGRPDNGLVTFNFTSPTSLSVTLQNTAGPSQLGGISSVLDGVTFNLSGAPSGVTLTGAQAVGTVTATNGLVFNNPSGGITQTGSSPFGWSLQIQGGTLQLFAGGDSFKPYGIVNNNITATDGLDNAQHNPYLNGPVTFNLSLTGLSGTPEVTSANLYFGTRPDIQAGSPVPLPSALLLLGPGLAGLTVVRRRLHR